MSIFRIGIATLVLVVGTFTAASADTVVFSTDFESGLPSEIDAGAAPAQIDGVQGYAGLGPSGNQFSGSFLRSPTGNVVTLSLTGLPSHSALSLEFLFAAIDSLDGTGTFPQGDFLNVSLDGTSFFRESFANALASQVQSYVPPAGVELARRVDLGFTAGGPNTFYSDSAYNLGADSLFHNLPHTASSAVFTFLIEGPGIQALTDESWAMDNLKVTAAVNAVPIPAALPLFAGGLGLLAWMARRKRKAEQLA